jgi:hypothetical protein
VSIVDRLIAEARVGKRWTGRLVQDRRLEKFRQALAEAERAGSRESIDRFVQRLKCGEFDH